MPVIASFNGMRPAVAADQLPDGFAQLARNCRLLSGNLAPWRSLGVGAQPIVKTGTIRSMYLMDAGGLNGGPFLLHHNEDVIYAPSPVAANTDDRTYITGLDAPRVTTRALATDPPPPGAAGAYPYDSLLLGVPKPAAAPTLVVDVVTPVAGQVAVTNPGAEAGLAGWTVLSGDVVQSTAEPHSGTASFRGGDAASSELYQDIDLDAAGLIAGQTLDLTWWQQAMVDSATMAMRFLNSSAALIGEVALDANAPGAWTQRGALSAVIPTAAVVVRLVQRYVRAGGSGMTDAYIDDISLIGSTAALSYDGSSLGDWLTSGSGIVEVDSSVGWPAPSFRFRSGDGPASMFRNCNIAKSPRYSFDYEFKIDAEFDAVAVVIAADSSGSGTQIAFTRDGVYLQQTGAWGATNNSSTKIGSANYRGPRIKAHVVVEDGQATKRIAVATTNAETLAPMESLSTEATLSGDYIGFKGWNFGDTRNAWLDNVLINITPGTTTDTGTINYTNYVVTYRNTLGDRSKPSDPSRDVQAPSDNASVTVNTLTTAPAGYGITLKEIWRAVVGSDGEAAYRLVTTLPLATATFEDTLPDSSLEEDILDSDGWDVPPTDAVLLGIGANGVAFYGSNNQVFPSPVEHPHAVLTLYVKSLDYRVIGGRCIDNDCYVVTTGFPIILTGNDPTSLQPQKLEEGVGGLSARSIVSMAGVGVIYSSSRGLEYMNRAGSGCLTDGIVTEKEWARYAPATITAAVYDKLYIGFYEGPEPGGFVFDPRSKSFVDLDIHATAVFVDASTGKLHLAVDGEHRVFNSGDDLLTMTWQSPDALVTGPTNMAIAKLHVSGSIGFTLVVDGVDAFSTTVTSSMEFNLPDRPVAEERVSVRFTGKGTLKRASFAETVDEL